MLLEIIIPSISFLIGCIYFNRDDMSGEKDDDDRRYPR